MHPSLSQVSPLFLYKIGMERARVNWVIRLSIPYLLSNCLLHHSILYPSSFIMIIPSFIIIPMMALLILIIALLLCLVMKTFMVLSPLAMTLRSYGLYPFPRIPYLNSWPNKELREMGAGDWRGGWVTWRGTTHPRAAESRNLYQFSYKAMPFCSFIISINIVLGHTTLFCFFSWFIMVALDNILRVTCTCMFA